MRIKQLLVVLFFLFLMNSKSYGQYKGGIGIRFGYGWGITGKYFLDGARGNGNALEFMLRYGYHGIILTKPGFNVTALYEKHWLLGRSDRWSILLGGGPEIGYGKRDTKQTFAFGVAPILGFDVVLARLPINFTFDYKPTFFVDKVINTKGALFNVSYYEVALSMRYAFE